jgi:hypothetical protein
MVFRLTSPEMRGEAVRSLQNALNKRLSERSERSLIVKADGVYGRKTSHAVARVAYLLGLQSYDGTAGVIRRIEHPSLRGPEELHLASQREKAVREAKERAKKAGKTGLAAVLVHAEHYIGIHESPANSNWGEPYPADWEKALGFDTGVSWCSCFASAMVNLAGGSLHESFCPTVEGCARVGTHGLVKWVPNHDEGVGEGWLALFNWSGGTEAEHVEIVKRVEPTRLVCVGGNTSGTEPQWGGMVAEEFRPYNFVLGYALPRIN